MNVPLPPPLNASTTAASPAPSPFRSPNAAGPAIVDSRTVNLEPAGLTNSDSVRDSPFTRVTLPATMSGYVPFSTSAIVTALAPGDG